MKCRLKHEAAVFLLALQFMTRFPVSRWAAWSENRMAEIPRWFPAVGIVVGALSAAVFAAAAAVYPPVVAAILATAAGVLATGALHEDGFADVCDGLGGGATRERALEIMRDSRIGVFGALGIGLTVGGKIAALAALPEGAVPVALVAGHCASRCAIVWVMACGSYVRPEGAGRAVSAPVSGASLAWASTFAAVPAMILCGVLAPVAGAAAVLGAAGGTFLMRALFTRKLGGYTGDCLGAVQQAAEIGLYMGVLACL